MSQIDLDRVLTIGAGGMIGSYVDFGLRPSHEVLDILDDANLTRYVQAERPAVIVHLAGATDMTRCEDDPAYAYELNVRGTYNVARAARAVDAIMVYASTSRVFKGDKTGAYIESDAPEPETHYGRTKHIGEIIVASLAPRHIIARTSWVFGGGPERDTKFYGKVLQQLHAGSEVAALSDVHGSPTYGKDYIAAIKELLLKGECGTFHIANKGEATRYDLASFMAMHTKSNVAVRAVDRSYFPSSGALPKNEAITSVVVALRPWQEALAEYLSEEWAFSR